MLLWFPEKHGCARPSRRGSCQGALLGGLERAALWRHHAPLYGCPERDWPGLSAPSLGRRSVSVLGSPA